MERSKMHIKTSLILLSLLIFVGCKNSMTKSDEMSDAQLIASIQEAQQTDISMEQLPALSRTVIYEDYNDYIEIGTKMASNLGYEVSMGGKIHKIGKHTEIYFNLEGKKLNPYRRNKEDWDKDDKDGWECLKLVFPIIFVMPDGSSTTVTSDDEQSWTELKSWYEANPHIEEKPSLQYPVVLSYKETNLTIESDDEMKDAYHRCSYKDDDKKDWDCFRLVYPITFILPDNSVISMEDEKDWAKLKSWYEANTDIEEKPALQYPVNIIYRDGDTKTINNDEEMASDKEDCRD